MDKLAEKIPEFCRAEYEKIANVNFSTAFPNIVPEAKEFRGHRLQPMFPSDGIDYAYDNWAPLHNDILIASFPRTGAFY